LGRDYHSESGAEQGLVVSSPKSGNSNIWERFGRVGFPRREPMTRKLLAISEYIAQNPVKAGLADSPGNILIATTI